MLLDNLPWLVIFSATALLWFPKLRKITWTLLIIGYSLAFAVGQLTLLASIPIALLLLAAWIISSQKKLLYHIVGNLIFVVLAVLLRMHWLPGFHNPLVISEHFTPGAVLYRMYLNLDKSLIAFWLLLIWPYIQLNKPWRIWLKVGAISGILTTATCISLALLLEIIAWEPKWPQSGYLWAINNLLLVTLTEEALFRGYVQGGIDRLMESTKKWNWLGLSIGALLFGLSHFEGGWALMLLAAIAGVGYGIAYRQGGLQAAVIAHAGLNLVHFSFFTYPMLAK